MTAVPRRSLPSGSPRKMVNPAMAPSPMVAAVLMAKSSDGGKSFGWLNEYQ